MFKSRYGIYKNWNKPLYISTRKEVITDDYNNEIITYNKPFYFGKINYQPLTGKSLEAYISAYGETKNKIVCGFIDSIDDNKFSELDVAYLYGATPTGEKENADNANYIVRTYRKQNTKIMVVFEEIVKEGNNEN